MKKAVIKTGSKQYIVSEGDTINVELLSTKGNTAEFEALLLIEDKTIKVGSPTLSDVKVTADVLEEDVQSDKVTSIRYKAKKRVKTVRGHRQHQTVIKIKSIS